ncbi:6,7-dimethyl-8-ribityllumazine synthase [Candidatus Pelagibacter sp.]|jgi:6,7-dimethyl-8-ribityllumazine synthase|nr:6,7-dimethyl-8-ribityllumazine synthase [Candidatus Pelagibacter sp.]|tara:strand:+ start:454 stop:840 length:387 start_codon:yes stop_codon:yes gene_type:complete
MKNKVLIIQANYYKDISTALLKSAKNELKNFAKINVISVPGVFEIPVVISKNLKKYDGFVALGCVIKGQTPHFDFISKSTTDAIMNISVESKKPVGNGIITCLNKNQAIARGKKGREAANAVKTILSL